MEENEDEPEDVRKATPVAGEIQKGLIDEPKTDTEAIVQKNKEKNGPRTGRGKKKKEKKTKKPKKEEELCGGRRGKKENSTKSDKFATFMVFDTPCKLPRSEIIPRQNFSKQEYIDHLATPSKKCPPDCIKIPVKKRVNPMSERMKELSRPSVHKMMLSVQEKAHILPARLIDNLIRTIEGESCFTPEQAEKILHSSGRKPRTKRKNSRKPKIPAFCQQDNGNSKNSKDLAFDRNLVTCQYLMAQEFVCSIINWSHSNSGKAPSKEDYQDIYEVVLKRISKMCRYEVAPPEDASLRMQLLADLVSSWISGVLMEVAQERKLELEEQRRKLEEERKLLEAEAEVRRDEEEEEEEEEEEDEGKGEEFEDKEEEEEEFETEQEEEEQLEDEKQEEEEQQEEEEEFDEEEKSEGSKTLVEEEYLEEREQLEEEKKEEQPEAENEDLEFIDADENGKLADLEQKEEAEEILAVEDSGPYLDALNDSPSGSPADEERIPSPPVPEPEEELPAPEEPPEETVPEPVEEPIPAPSPSPISVPSPVPPPVSAPIPESKLLQTELPFLTYYRILETLFSMLEKQQENLDQGDAAVNRLQRGIYEKLEKLVQLESPEVLTPESKDVLDVTSGKIAIWLKDLLTESRLQLLQEIPAQVESKELRDWSSWINGLTDLASNWNQWLRKVVREAEELRDRKNSRLEWSNWTRNVDRNAVVWRKLYLQSKHEAHHNMMMLKDRKVVKTGEKGHFPPAGSEQVVLETSLEG